MTTTILRRGVPLLFLVLSACQTASDPVSRGKAYFVGLGCKTCHMVAGEGGEVGPDLTFVGFRKSAEWMELKLQDPAQWRAASPMPKFNLTEPVRKDVVAYLASLKGEDYLKDKPWDRPDLKDDPVKRGELIYNRVGCVGCHGTAGAGGFPNNNVAGGQIPSLKLAADGYSKEEMHERISNGLKSDPEDPSKPAPMIEMPAWKNLLSSEEIDALVEYIYSIRPPRTAADDWSS
jgi:mono/diheme cytochrome c family protein